MRIATFNTLHGQPVLGTGGGLGSAVADLDADVLGLQEVDCGQPRSGFTHQVRAVAAEMGTEHWYFAPSVLGTPGTGPVRWQPAQVGDGQQGSGAAAAEGGPLYGVGLVSRLPVRSWRATVFDPAPFGLPLLVHDGGRARLMFVPDEPRAAIAAVVDGPHGSFTVATVHLSFVPGYNVRQLRALCTWLADLPRPLVLVGDLNLPGRVPALTSRWQSLARGATYPVVGPRVQLDHVLGDGLTAAQVAGASCRVHPLPVSDHCAVTVELDL